MKQLILLFSLIAAPIFIVYSNAQTPFETKPSTTLKLKGSKNPVISIDGIKQNKEYFSIGDVKPDSIEAITVLSADQAINLYGLEAADGAILVTTKSGKNNPASKALEQKLLQLNISKQLNGFKDLRFSTKPETTTDSTRIGKNVHIRLRGLQLDDHLQLTGELSKEVLYMVNGKKVENKDIKFLDPETIESITVLKDSGSLALYGTEGRNGVILITTKAEKVKPASDHNK